MITNCRELILPSGTGGAGFTSEVPPPTGQSEKVETTCPWHNHFMFMDGESETDDTVEEQTFDPHQQWIHFLD